MILDKIKHYDHRLLANLGQVGTKLHAFAKNIDTSHPGLVEVLDGLFVKNIKFTQETEQILDICSYAQVKGYNIALELIRKAVKKSEHYHLIDKFIDDPAKNYLNVRLVPDQQQRNTIRSFKKVIDIELSSLGKKGKEIWITTIDDFSTFIRYGKYFDLEVKKAEEVAQKYLSIGLTCMYDEVKKSIDEFHKQIVDTYYGFNRITCVNCSIIAAKNIGLDCEVLNDKFFIYITNDFFQRYNFVTNKEKWQFSPRLYPLYYIKEIIDDSTSDLINKLENEPCIGNKALFDFFWVLVPTINYPADNNLLDDKRRLTVYSSLAEARKSFDLTLIRMGLVKPILLGEKDNKVYFLKELNENYKKSSRGIS